MCKFYTCTTRKTVMLHVIVNGPRFLPFYIFFSLFHSFLSSFVFSQLSTKLTLTSKYIAPFDHDGIHVTTANARAKFRKKSGSLSKSLAN